MGSHILEVHLLDRHLAKPLRELPMHPGEDQPDTLAIRIAAEDPNAFRELFDREVGGLVRFTTAILGSPEDAREVVQESFFRLWQNRGRLDNNSDPPRLLYTIARNLARDRLRHRAVERRPHPRLETPNVVEAGALGVDEEAEPDERLEVVMQALKTLSPRQLEVLLLRWRRQLTYEQIGAELGIAPGTASAHMQRAIGQLKTLLPQLLGK